VNEDTTQEFPPEQLRERLQQILSGERYEAFVDQALLPKRAHVRVNTLRSDVEEVRGDLERMGIRHEPLAWCDHAFVTESEPRALQDSRLWKNGGFHIQSPSSIATSLVLAPEPGERILDMCAAPGSKTSHIAALMNNEGELVANDLSKPRMHRMRALLELMGAKALVRRSAGEQIGRREPVSFDRVLVDAPCSGEGRMRPDDPGSYKNWRPKVPKQLSSRQKSLLHSAIEAVRPGGVVVYSTCTFSVEENELVLARALKLYEGQIEMQALPIELPGAMAPCREWQNKSLPEIPEARRLGPPEYDGFFIARLLKIR
jgi:NOL1/NOP2/sun family putative RNA methylase